MSKALDLAVEAEGRLTVVLATKALSRAIVQLDDARNGWPTRSEGVGGGSSGAGGSPVEAMHEQPDPAAADLNKLVGGLTAAHNAVSYVWCEWTQTRHMPVTVDDVANTPLGHAERTRGQLHVLVATGKVRRDHLRLMSHTFGAITTVWSVCLAWTTIAPRPKSEELTWCELHAAVGSQEPAARRKRMRGRPPMPLCTWCYQFAADEGRLPTLQQVDHRARGIPVRRRE